MAYTTIDNPFKFFNNLLWTGTGSSNALTGVGFEPDWVWIKQRSGTENHNIFDSVRGVTKRISSNRVNAEDTQAQQLTAFGTDGFTVGTDDGANKSSSTYVSWNWKAGTTSSISGGSITPAAVSINATSGFGIYRYTATGSNGTIAHGLGTAPKFIVTKNRDSGTYGWYAYHVGIGATKSLYLHNNDAEVTSSNRWNDTAPTSTLFTLSTNDGVNGSSANMIAYAFSEVKGYSKIGSYTGNGNADGAFVYTGFKPAWLMMKRADDAGEWLIYDNKRDPFNLRDTRLEAQDNFADSTGTTKVFDFLSNGFKCKGSDADINASSGTYVYLAFAEAPFVTAGTKAAGTAA